MFKKVLASILLLLSVFVSIPASADVLVSPQEVTAGSFSRFQIEVGGDGGYNVSKVRLVLPEGLYSVSPMVKVGWEANTKKADNSDNSRVEEIVWQGGFIPVGQRDVFEFVAKVPDTGSDLNWKVYQTSKEGQTLAWDQEQVRVEEGKRIQSQYPYATSKIVSKIDEKDTQIAKISDLKETQKNLENTLSQSNNLQSLSTVLSLFAIVVAVIALLRK